MCTKSKSPSQIMLKNMAKFKKNSISSMTKFCCAYASSSLCTAGLKSNMHCIFIYKYAQLTLSNIISLWASNRNPAPPGGFLETTIFGNLSHRAIEIRLPAKIPVLDKAVRALFSKWPPNFNKYLVFGTISLYFDNFHSV